MSYEEIIKHYIKKSKREETRRNNLKKQVEMLEKKLKNLKYTSWIDEVIKPLAIELNKQMPNRHFEILGPFGLSAEVPIHFYKNSLDEKKLNTSQLFAKRGNCKSITILPNDLEHGRLFIRDFSKNTKRYAEGTIAEMNGYNYPEVEIPKNATIEWFMKWVR